MGHGHMNPEILKSHNGDMHSHEHHLVKIFGAKCGGCDFKKICFLCVSDCKKIWIVACTLAFLAQRYLSA